MNNSTETIPNHWELLNESDKADYISLKVRFHDEITKSRRGERIEVFVSRLRNIREFIEKDDTDQWKRILVCGIMFLNDALGINIQQLKILMGKCKSSINGSLQQLGYIAKPSTHDSDQEITKKVPFLKEDHYQLKKWTIRFGHFPENKDIPLKYISKPSNKPKIQKEEKQQKLVIESQPSSPIYSMANEMMNLVYTHFPCPAKCRHKYLDLINSSISIQTVA